MRALAAQGFSGGDGAGRPVEDEEGCYAHLQAVLKRFAYPRLKRADQGLVQAKGQAASRGAVAKP